MMAEVARRGSLAGIPGVPEKVRRLFVTAFDVAPDWHVKMQAAFQKFTDNGVSKTVNLPQEAAQADVRRIYLLAHQLRCKGITIYRYGSKPQQVLTIEEEAPSVSCE
jgi:ribonucleoside-diphosphate reductase alpha chain